MSDSTRRGFIAIIVLFGALLLLCLCGVGVWLIARPGIDIVRRYDLAPRPTTLPQTPAATAEAPATARPTATPINSGTPLPPPTLPTPVAISPESDVETTLLTNLYERVNPSVVNITVLARAGDQIISPSLPVPTPVNPDELVPTSQGSGFVWDAEGHIVTNAHVVDEAEGIRITFADGTIAEAEIIGADPDSDLAVIKVDPAAASLVALKPGEMKNLRVGERVAAIGNPFGYNGTLTAGIVSAIGRSISSLTQFNIPNVIQTDAPINPGNSGGPLLNMNGEVVGVNAQIETSGGVRANSGVGFAIPISIVQRVVPSLIENGFYRHAYLGITGSTFSPFCAELLGIDAKQRGAYVNEVVSGGPAEKAGVLGGTRPTNQLTCPEKAGGDLILAINGQSIQKFDDLLVYLETSGSPGDTITLTILRGGETKDVSVELARRPAQNQ